MKLILFYAGDSPNSRGAKQRLREVLEGGEPDAFELETIDVLDLPEVALDHDVLVTPLLLKVDQNEERRMIGDLSKQGALELFLGIKVSE